MSRWRLKTRASRLFAQPIFQAQIKENIKALRHWPPVTGGYPSWRANNAEKVSIWWRILFDDAVKPRALYAQTVNCNINIHLINWSKLQGIKCFCIVILSANVNFDILKSRYVSITECNPKTVSLLTPKKNEIMSISFIGSHISVIVYHLNVTRLFIKQLVQANITGYIKTRHYKPIGMWSRAAVLFLPTRRTSNAKAFPCHDVIIHTAYSGRRYHQMSSFHI